MKNEMKRKPKVRKTEAQLKNILKNVLGNDKRRLMVDELVKAFVAAHPRLADQIEQKLMLEEMCNIYVRWKFEVQPALDEMWNIKDLVAWRQLRNPANKMEMQVDRLMSKLGFTYTAQPMLKALDRKSYDPKATNAVQESVADLIKATKSDAEESK